MRSIEIYAVKKHMYITPLDNREGYFIESKKFDFIVKYNEKPKGFLLTVREKYKSDNETSILFKTQKAVIEKIDKVLEGL